MDNYAMDSQFIMHNDLVDDSYQEFSDIHQGLHAPVKADDDADMDDLFGDEAATASAQPTYTAEASASASVANDDASADDDFATKPKDGSQSPARSAHDTDELSAAERQHRKNLEYEEEDDNPDDAVVELKHAVLSIPNLPMPRSSDGENWVIKLPNFVKLDPKPFHPDTYIGPEQSDDYPSLSSVRERSMSIKLEVENTIRWKWTKDEFGQDKRQSNSRIIRWSDGSMSLLLGKELFDISRAYDTSASASAQRRVVGPGAGSQLQSQSQSQPQLSNSQSQSQLGSAQSLTQSQGGPVGANRGLTYLVAQHKRAGILQAEAPITGTMSLRPTGMQSETHRMLVRAVGQKHSKVARLRFAPDSMAEVAEKERAAAAAGEKKGRRKRGSGEGAGGGTRRRRSYGRRRGGESVWSDEDMEGHFGDTDDEEEDAAYSRGSRRFTRSTGSPTKVKDSANARRGAGEYVADDFLVDDSSEADADADGEVDEDAEGEVDVDADADDFETGSRKRKSKKDTSSGKRRHRSEDEEGGEVDALDEIDARIAKQEEEEKKKRRAQGAGADAEEGGAANSDAAMDVESEDADANGGRGHRDEDGEDDDDDDEDFQVRRAGTGSRRKRAITLEEEEE